MYWWTVGSVFCICQLAMWEDRLYRQNANQLLSWFTDMSKPETIESLSATRLVVLGVLKTFSFFSTEIFIMGKVFDIHCRSSWMLWTDLGQCCLGYSGGEWGGKPVLHHLEGDLHPRRFALLWCHPLSCCMVSILSLSLSVLSVFLDLTHFDVVIFLRVVLEESCMRVMFS